MPSPTSAFRGQGCRFLLSTKASGSVDGDFTLVSELRDINITGQSDELDASNMDTAGAFKEFVAGMKSMDLQIQGNHLPRDPSHDGATGLLARWIAGDKKEFRLDYIPAGLPYPRIQGVGIVLRYSPSVTAMGLATLGTQFRITGAPVFSTFS